MEWTVLDKTKIEFRRKSQSEVMAMSPAEFAAYRAECDSHPLPPVTHIFDFTKPERPSLPIDGYGSAYLNHGSADCPDGDGL